MHLDDDDRVPLLAELVEDAAVDEFNRVVRTPRPGSPEGRSEEDHLAVPSGRDRVVRSCAASNLSLWVEELVHPRGPGRRDALLRKTERLGVEGHLVGRAHGCVRVVLVHARVRAQPSRLADPTVAHGLEGTPRVPELDDPLLRPPRKPVDGGLVILEQDDLRAREEPDEPDPVRERSADPKARPEEHPEPVLAVEAAFHHTVVHELQVATERLAGVGGEDDDRPVARERMEPGHEQPEELDPGPPHQLAPPAADRAKGQQRVAADGPIPGRDLDREWPAVVGGPYLDPVHRPSEEELAKRRSRDEALGVDRYAQPLRLRSGPPHDHLPAPGIERHLVRARERVEAHAPLVRAERAARRSSGQGLVSSIRKPEEERSLVELDHRAGLAANVKNELDALPGQFGDLEARRLEG
jgi:hypothetical protein